jgi:PTH2 family peptidyl-tRNA hydrolase
MEPKQVIVMRKDLNMRKGKMCAQSAHASLAVLLDRFLGPLELRGGDLPLPITINDVINADDPLFQWITKSFKKIVVGAESLSECVEAYNLARLKGIPCALIEDKGLTEFGGKITITCCAIGPADPEEIDKITGHLKLL